MSRRQETFVRQFRASAPYIRAHRGKTFVVATGGEALGEPGLRALLWDVALLNSLGVRMVLVVGARPQIDAELARRNLEPKYHNHLRVTDAVALECAMEASGTIRVQLEALLSTGLPNSPMAGAQVRVATGNFVTAQPIGVIDGVDYEFTGTTRRVDAEAIKQNLDQSAIVILTPIGYSVTGEAFNVSSADLAAHAAAALHADKLVALVAGEGFIKDGEARVAHLTPEKAVDLLGNKVDKNSDQGVYLEAAIKACKGGVSRAHLIPRGVDGSLLRELFTQDGVGTMVSDEQIGDIRRATIADIAGIIELVEPLEEQGVLVKRSRDLLQRDISNFIVQEVDGMIISCAAMYPHSKDNMIELACLAVRGEYQEQGRATQLLRYIELTCAEKEIKKIFVLTTQTEHWFRERGFEQKAPADLPAARRKVYDQSRASHVLIKSLSS